MSDDVKFTRDKRGYVEDLGGGLKRSVVVTSAGTPSVQYHQGGRTWEVAPESEGIKSVRPTQVGGGLPRVSVERTTGETTDLTARSDRSVDVQTHRDGATWPGK